MKTLFFVTFQIQTIDLLRFHGLIVQKMPEKFIYTKQVRYLCLVNHISVGTLSLAFNLVSLGSYFISLSNDVSFVRMMHLLDEHHI